MNKDGTFRTKAGAGHRTLVRVAYGGIVESYYGVSPFIALTNWSIIDRKPRFDSLKEGQTSKIVCFLKSY